LQKTKKTSLKSYNSFGVNAISTKFSIANSEKKIIEFLERISFSSPIILGGGTNILFKNNIDTNIIKIEIKGITITSETSKHIDISVGAGEKWDDLVNWSIQRNYGGLENLSLIPGNVGSAPIQNIGAYGVELKDCFLRCRAVSVESGTIKIFNNNECDFSYRSSIFKKDLKNKYIISNVSFRLSKKNHKINLSYEPLKKHIINKNITEPTIKDISNSVIEIRNSKLPDPKIIGNCGSFFKNPIISLIDFKKLNETQNNVPFFNVSPDKVKVPAAWLIEKCGFKGKKEGNTGTHKAHALIIVNHGKATGKEIFNFAQKIKNAVLRKFNILLEEEVNIIEN